MKLFTANLVSLLFHPLVFAILAPFLVIYHSTNDPVSGIRWSLFTMLFVGSVIGVLFLVRGKEFFHDFDISKREKRPLFYSISLFFAVLYFTIAVYLKSLLFPLSLVALGIIIGLVIFEFANMYLKVSIHSAISCAFVITFGLLYGTAAYLSVIWIPFAVAWSRIILQRHTWREIVSGAVLGCSVTMITFAIAEVLL